MSAKTDLFTASDIARFCDVDLKTIHNWVDKGSLTGFRTPGRHLRFKRLAVLDFLRKFGYSVPAIVSQLGASGSSGKNTLVVIEPDATKVPALIECLSDTFDIRTFTSAAVALVAMGENPPDALVFDCRDLAPKAVTHLKATERVRHLRFVVLYPGNDAPLRAEITDAGAHEVLKRGDYALLKEALIRVLSVEPAQVAAR